VSVLSVISSHPDNMLRLLLVCGLVATALAGKCGTHHQKTVDWPYKIVGGQDADPGEYPWQVSMQYKGWGGQSSHYCGAALIHEDWVMWAAHCAAVYDKHDTIVLGEHDLTKDDGTEQTLKASKIITHEKYDDATVENDISLLKLEKSMKDFEPVCLPKQGHDFTGKATVTGWGTTSEGGDLADILQEVVVPIIDDKTCKEEYAKENYDIFPTMICSGEKGKDSCQGDSGGPMMCKDGGKFYSCGIVSWGLGCARKGFPGVYTEVAQFRDWIQEHTGF